MKGNKQTRHDAKSLFHACVEGGLLDEQRVRQVVTLVLAKKPRGYTVLLGHFRRLVRLELNRRTARVASAVALDTAQQQGLSARLRQWRGDDLRVEFRQDAALLGGLRVQVGSDVVDGSVRARLDALAGAFDV
ncbi:MAG: H(+)-transporting ATPase [Pedosphaera sp.]|nr:H(+)-transporting ATPase [Pedosphaera sp.]MSU43251.1 H(+)-transporting ATPase [Pedosphaera sp.]